eukprot:1049270-Prymnesium_polylepis.1
MLGTNDAHEAPADWHAPCSRPDASAATCPFLADYLALTSIAKSRTTGAAPLVAVAVPPPLMREG